MPDSSKHLLLVEDEPLLREAVAQQLADHGYQVQQVDSGEAALAHLAEFAFDIVVTDLRLPGIDGSAVVEAAVERYPEIIAIVVTGYGTVKDAVEAIKRGAWDFVNKPFQIDELLHVLESALEQRRLKSENAYLRAQLEERYRFEGMIGKSRAMTRLFQLLETVAPTSSTILITGETGTGKEVVARAIHHNSPRRAHRFVAINCSAIPETLLEAELFGHVRGAFTGAVGNRQGRLEQAHKGTLFLDEVGTMSTALQMKLLRVLQEREFERVGESHTTKVDVRVIAATNSDLKQMVADGQFREDLVLSAQRHSRRAAAAADDRKDDIPLLVQHFLDRFRPATVASQEAMRRLMAYSWPGNVRQLENAIERAIAFSGGRSQIDVGDLPREIQQAQELPLRSSVDLPEEGVDLDALHRGHRTRFDRAVARAHRRQQGSGRKAPQPQAHDARRKTEALCATASRTQLRSGTAGRMLVPWAPDAGKEEEMRKARRVLILLMFIGAAIVVQPRAASAQAFESGVKVGFVVTGLPNAGQVVDQVVGAPSEESTSRIGLTGGGYIRFPINNRLGFQPEVLFAMKGVQLSEKDAGGTVNIRINYLDVPLLVRYRIPINSRYDGFLVVGPNFGIKISSSAKLDAPGGTVDEDIDPALKSLDLGLAFGGGITFRRYLVEGRFTAGLTDVASTLKPHADSLRNRTFSVLVGMKLP